MTITKNANRQELVSAYVEFDLEDLVGPYVVGTDDISYGALTSASAHTTAITLPVGAVVVSGHVTVIEPFNSATSDSLAVGDVSVANRYLAAGDLQSAAGTQIALVPTGFIGTVTQAALKVTWTKVGASPTAGRFGITVSYYVVSDVVEQTVNVLYSDLTSGSAYATTLALPVGAVLLSGNVAIVTPFNSQTSDVVVVGDASVANRYVASTDIHTGAATPIAFVPTGFEATSGEPVIKLTWTKVGTAPSAGALAVTIRYAIPTTVQAIDLPHKAQVLSGALTVLTAMNSATSDSLSIGDSASKARYLSAQSAQSTGQTALLPTGFKTTGVTPVTVKWKRLSGTTAPTAGSLRLRVDYMVDSRVAFSQG